jgi:hypothetical protein
VEIIINDELLSCGDLSYAVFEVVVVKTVRNGQGSLLSDRDSKTEPSQYEAAVLGAVFVIPSTGTAGTAGQVSTALRGQG